MVKHPQTIRRLLPTNSLSVFDHFVGLTLKVLIVIKSGKTSQYIVRKKTNVFFPSLEEFCDIDLSFQQKMNLLEASSKIFGSIDDWDDDIFERLCDNIEALSPDDILKIPASEVRSFNVIK